MLDHSCQVQRHPLSERGHDLYETPDVAVHALLNVEKLPHKIWEPACGRGAIVKILRGAGHYVHATDLIDYGAPASFGGVDFLKCSARCSDAILTNPPFKIAAQFASKALDLTSKVYLLLRLAFFEAGNQDTEPGRARRRVLDEIPPARVHVFKNRLPMMHRDGWEGRKSNSGMAFAWFVWDRDHKGPTTIDRITWNAAYDAQADLGGSIALGLETIRERVAAGGEPWTPGWRIMGGDSE